LVFFSPLVILPFIPQCGVVFYIPIHPVASWSPRIHGALSSVPAKPAAPQVSAPAPKPAPARLRPTPLPLFLLFFLRVIEEAADNGIQNVIIQPPAFPPAP